MKTQVDGATRSFGSFLCVRKLPAIFGDVPDIDAGPNDPGELSTNDAVAGRVGSAESPRGVAGEEPDLGRARCA